MSLKDAADLATALTLIVAAAGFVLSLYERFTRERADQILRWQKVVIYQIIEDGIIDFDQIKLHYLSAVQQFPDFKIPKKEIQDGALKLVLLSLTEAKLISKTTEGEWAINTVSLQENALKDIAFSEFTKKMSTAKLMSQLYEMVDRESGKLTIDQLHRHLNAADLGFSFEDFNVQIRELINRGVFILDKEQRVWARPRLPQQQPKPPGPASA